MLDESQHLLVKLSCESACENLDAISARSALCFFSANIAVEQEVIVAAIVIAVGLFARHALLIYKTQRRVEKGQKMGRAEVIQTWVVHLTVFSTLPQLVCVCLSSVGTCEKSRLLALKTNIATCC